MMADAQTSTTRKTKIALLSVGSNSCLIALKTVVGITSGSVSIISEAIHSSMDLLAAIIAFFAVRKSDKAADREHPYGHGKVENVSGVIEALLILVASAWIVIEAVNRILNPEHRMESIGIGFAVMLVSALVNTLVSRKLYKVAKEEHSVALEADALHLKADVITSLGVGLGLLAIWVAELFGLNWLFLDPIIAIAVAVFIVREAVQMLVSAFKPLMDHALPDEELVAVQAVLDGVKNQGGDWHELRTRISGKVRHIDCHVTLPPSMTVEESHRICDALEKELENAIPYVHAIIHVEPAVEHGS